MQGTLIGNSGLVNGREYQLDKPVLTIGRRDENDVVIKDSTVSRKHAEIRREGDDFVLVDKNSASGVTVNGVRIEGTRRLEHGDQIAFGANIFTLQLYAPASQTVMLRPEDLAALTAPPEPVAAEARPSEPAPQPEALTQRPPEPAPAPRTRIIDLPPVSPPAPPVEAAPPAQPARPAREPVAPPPVEAPRPNVGSATPASPATVRFDSSNLEPIAPVQAPPSSGDSGATRDFSLPPSAPPSVTPPISGQDTARPGMEAGLPTSQPVQRPMTSVPPQVLADPPARNQRLGRVLGLTVLLILIVAALVFAYLFFLANR